MTRRTLAVALAVVVLATAVLATSCARPKLLADAWWDYVDRHNHLRVRLIDRKDLGFIFLMYVMDLLTDEGPKLASDFQPPPEPVPLTIPPTAAKPFYDHELDGLWHGRTNVYFDGGYGQMPFLLLANASDGWVYVSVVFQDVNQCVTEGEAGWTAVYSDKVELDPARGELRFEKVASRWLTPFVPDIAKLDFSFSAYPRKDYFTGRGQATYGRRARLAFETRDEFFKVKRTGGVQGLWSSGFTAQVYAGEFLDPPIFHPTVMSVVDRSGVVDMSLYVLWSDQQGITAQIDGKRLTFSFWTPNGLVDGDFALEGRELVGQAWDPLLGSYMDLAFVPAGTNGETPRLKRVKPKTLALSQPGKASTLTVIGKDFAPGAMVFFGNSEVRLLSVDFVSKKKLKVRVAAEGAIAAGSAVDVMVLNPDNRSAQKARAFRTR